MKTLTKILIAVGITTVIFMIINIVLFIIFQAIPETLVERYFTCVIGECGVTGAIQIAKEILKRKDQVDSDAASIEDSDAPTDEEELDYEIEEEEGVEE